NSKIKINCEFNYLKTGRKFIYSFIIMKTIILILSIALPIFPQWETGASYKIKSDIPKHGIGINISRNLPLQGATFGVHLRAEVNLFRETVSVNFTGINEEHKFLS